VDPLGGGTWIGVNDAGLAVALLNRSAGEPPRTFPRSRGVLVPLLLDTSSIEAMLDVLLRTDVSVCRPFRLVVVHGRRLATVTAGGGRPFETRSLPATAPALFTSSSLGDALVDGPRLALFGRMVVDAPTSEWARRQSEFHRHRWPARPHVSVMMARDDAATVSRTTIEVTPGRRRLVYRALTLPAGRQWCSFL
jgi:hypothetical protein